ncbi:huntingtin-interacting protein 1-related protein-like [Formica exsecta]|uniref:huntingtin-interacting protein 1-related protein-like n=1 Tax=Formica exsecta TaxID=72781 RepID=UPI001142F08F|nr:huntingtin-interacting protein 1-related protein-like [Formica exsecta]
MKKAELEKELGGLKISREQSERRMLKAEERLQELLQGQGSAEQEAQKVTQARKDLEDVRKRLDAAQTENLALAAKIDFITSEKTALEGDLHDLLVQKEELDLRIVNLETDGERYRNQVKTDANTALFDLLLNAISEAESILHHAMHAIDNPAISALTCTPDYLENLLEPTEKSLNDLEEAYNNYISDTTKGKALIRTAIHSAYFLALYLIYAKSTSNTSTDIGLADRFADECKQLGSQGLIILSYIKEKSSMTVVQIANVKSQLQKISSLINALSTTQNNVEIIGSLVENELQSMDKAIEEAVARIQN